MIYPNVLYFQLGPKNPLVATSKDSQKWCTDHIVRRSGS